MERKAHLDAFGTVLLVGFALLMGLNQVVIKVTTGGLQPVFMAGVRSLGGLVCIWLWMRYRGIAVRFPPEMRGPGLLIGTVFALEFLLLFTALDLTTVSRSSVIFYSMPVWATIGGHFVLQNEKLTAGKIAGLALAVVGVAWALLDRGAGNGEGSFIGDLFALLASFCWAAIALIAKGTALSRERPEMQLFWQLAVSAPLLLLAATFFGPPIREFTAIHAAGLTFQIVVVVFAAFLLWFHLLTVYPAASVVSFSFLAPIFGVLLGWSILSEPLGIEILGALALVTAGLILINRPQRS